MPPGATTSSHFDVLGVRIDALDPHTAVDRIEDLIAREEASYIVFCTVSTIVAAGDDPAVRRALEDAALVAPDGMPLVWLGRRAGVAVERVYGPDLLVEVMERTRGRYRHFLYGGGPGVAERMAAALRERFPEIQIVGTASPRFGVALEDAAGWDLEEIGLTSPDIVWVGLGHPRQEKWMRLHHATLGPCVAAGVGAAFDFLAGDKKEAPPWMKRAGLQWAHRLASEPRRLWRRYLIGNSTFLIRLARERLPHRRRHED